MTPRTPPELFYTDSTSNVLISWWEAAGVLPRSWLFYPLTGCLYRMGTWLGLELVHAVILTNTALALVSLLALFAGAARLFGARAALLACALVSSVPSFAKLAVSGEYEMTGLAFVCVGFWLACVARTSRGARAWAAAAAAVCSLWLASFARVEAAGLVLLSGLAWAWRCRASRGGAVGAVLLTAALLALRLPKIAAHGLGTMSYMSLVERPGGGRALATPAAFLRDAWPWALALAAGWRARHAWSRDADARGAVLLVAGQLGLLWFGSLLHAFSGGPEISRNVLQAQALSAPAGAAALLEWGRRRPEFRRLGALLLAAWLAAQWWSATRAVPILTARIQAQRALGRQLRELQAAGALGEGSILLEPVDRDWPNALVYSGMPDRFRMIGGLELEWARRRRWAGEGPVGAAVVCTADQLAKLRRSVGPLKSLAQSGRCSIYRARGGPQGQKT